MTEEVLCNEKLLYTKKEAARTLNVSERTVDRLIKNGEIPRISSIGKVLIPFKALEEFISNNSFYNRNGVGETVQHPQGESICLINAATAPTTGVVSKTPSVGKELDALLERRRKERPTL
jgi:excisionase family DNA binding protein